MLVFLRELRTFNEDLQAEAKKMCGKMSEKETEDDSGQIIATSAEVT